MPVGSVRYRIESSDISIYIELSIHRNIERVLPSIPGILVFLMQVKDNERKLLDVSYIKIVSSNFCVYRHRVELDSRSILVFMFIGITSNLILVRYPTQLIGTRVTREYIPLLI